MARFRCSRCATTTPTDAGPWHCPCGGLFDLDAAFPAPRPAPDAPWDLRRYSEQLPCPPHLLDRLTLGEGCTPLLAPDDTLAPRPGLLLKCDHTQPTGSFKDRGSVVVVAAAVGRGVQRLVVDSSGNAGSSIATYAARARLPCEVFVPASASPAKVLQIQAFGARVHLVDGPRENAAEGARQAADVTGTWYASHVTDPHFVHGTKTWAYEVWEQLRGVPDLVVLPVGNGSLLLGLVVGFGELLAAGVIDRLPRVLAVQVPGFASLSDDAPDGGETVAEGIAIRRPARLAQLKEALRRCDGATTTVDDPSVLAATAHLASGGIWVEPTGAVAWAAVRAGHPVIEAAGSVVVALGGAGWKSVR